MARCSSRNGTAITCARRNVVPWYSHRTWRAMLQAQARTRTPSRVCRSRHSSASRREKIMLLAEEQGMGGRMNALRVMARVTRTRSMRCGVRDTRCKPLCRHTICHGSSASTWRQLGRSYVKVLRERPYAPPACLPIVIDYSHNTGVIDTTPLRQHRRLPLMNIFIYIISLAWLATPDIEYLRLLISWYLITFSWSID